LASVSRRVASEEEEEKLTTTMAKAAEAGVTVTDRFWSTITGKCFIGFVVIFEVSIIPFALHQLGLLLLQHSLRKLFQNG